MNNYMLEEDSTQSDTAMPELYKVHVRVTLSEIAFSPMSPPPPPKSPKIIIKNANYHTAKSRYKIIDNCR